MIFPISVSSFKSNQNYLFFSIVKWGVYLSIHEERNTWGRYQTNYNNNKKEVYALNWNTHKKACFRGNARGVETGLQQWNQREYYGGWRFIFFFLCWYTLATGGIFVNTAEKGRQNCGASCTTFVCLRLCSLQHSFSVIRRQVNVVHIRGCLRRVRVDRVLRTPRDLYAVVLFCYLLYASSSAFFLCVNSSFLRPFHPSSSLKTSNVVSFCFDLFCFVIFILSYIASGVLHLIRLPLPFSTQKKESWISGVFSVVTYVCHTLLLPTTHTVFERQE